MRGQIFTAKISRALKTNELPVLATSKRLALCTNRRRAQLVQVGTMRRNYGGQQSCVSTNSLSFGDQESQETSQSSGETERPGTFFTFQPLKQQTPAQEIKTKTQSEDQNTRRIPGWDQESAGAQRRVTARVSPPYPRAFVRPLSIFSVYTFLMASPIIAVVQCTLTSYCSVYNNFQRKYAVSQIPARGRLWNNTMFKAMGTSCMHSLATFTSF